MGVLTNIVSVLHILLAIFLISTILMQSSKRTGLSGSISGAAETFFGKSKNRGMDALLGRLTAVSAIVFLCTSLYLAYNFAFKPAETPVTDGEIPITTNAPDALTPEEEAVEGESVEGEESGEQEPVTEE